MEAPPILSKIRERLTRDNSGHLAADYSDEYMPIGGYAAIMGTYSFVFGGGPLLAKNAARIPERLSAADVVLLGIATHKQSRIITKDWVTIPLRVLFHPVQKVAAGGRGARGVEGKRHPSRDR
jgi:hypothetical protein